MKKSHVFRQVSIERLSSPEQLDQLLQVVHPRGWVALGGFGMMIVSLIFWGFTGSIPTNVAGSGVLIRTGGISKVTATGSGRVVDVAVRAGEVIEAGQVVARIQHPELEERLRQAEAELEELQKQRDQEETFSSARIQLELDNLSKRRETLERTIAADREQVDWLRDKIVDREDLLEEGLITRQQLLNTRQQLQQTEQKIEQSQSELQQIEIDRQRIMSDNERAETTRTFDINAQQRVVRRLQDELRRKSRVRSSDKGRAIEVRVKPGDLIAKGEPILSFSRVGRDVQTLEAVVYVTARDGKKVQPGMAIQISPATVEAEEYGRMLGMVTYVSDYPATSDGMMQLLGNQQLVQTLSSQGAPYEVHADVMPAPDTPSGYKWTSSGGPPTKIQTGTICQSKITVTERRPVELVMPTVRRLLGS